MEKPFNLKLIETKQKLIQIINESGMPLTVMSMVFNELLLNVNSQIPQQIETEKKQYEESLKEVPVLNK